MNSKFMLSILFAAFGSLSATPVKTHAIPAKKAPVKAVPKKTPVKVAPKPAAKQTQPLKPNLKQIQQDVKTILESPQGKAQLNTKLEEIIALAKNPSSLNNSLLKKLGLSADQIIQVEDFLKSPTAKEHMQTGLDDIINNIDVGGGSNSPLALILETTIPEVVLVVIGLVAYAVKTKFKTKHIIEQNKANAAAQSKKTETTEKDEKNKAEIEDKKLELAATNKQKTQEESLALKKLQQKLDEYKKAELDYKALLQQQKDTNAKNQQEDANTPPDIDSDLESVDDFELRSESSAFLRG